MAGPLAHAAAQAAAAAAGDVAEAIREQVRAELVALWRSERKRHYRYPGQSPLQYARLGRDVKQCYNRVRWKF